MTATSVSGTLVGVFQRLLLLLFLFTTWVSPWLSAYEVKINGVTNRQVAEKMSETSLLISERERPPASFPALQYRAESDVKRLLDVAHSDGYYGAQIHVRYEREPLAVILTVDLGVPYPLTSFDLEPPDLEDDPWEGKRYPLDTIQPRQLGLRLGDPAIAAKVLDAEAKILRMLERCGYPLARIANQEAIVDMEAETVAVTLTVDSGPLCTFGPLTIEGLRKVKRRFVIQCLGWREGQVFTPKRVEETLAYLRRSGLFRGIRVIHAGETDPEGRLPVTIELEERKPRSIAVGISYNIDQGFGPEFEWEHRNLWGMGEDLTLRATTGTRKQEVGAIFRKPHFYHCDQDLILYVDGTHENKPGYLSNAATVGGLIDRIWNKHWAYSYGVEFEQLSTKRTDNNGDFSLLTFPLGLRLLTTDDMLDPQRGMRGHLKVRPTANFVNNETIDGRNIRFFTKQQLTLSYYQTLIRKRLVLALWGTIGTIWGSSDIDIPAPKRFYAGSDTTLRGYSYQTVGPLGANGKPVGGRSLLVVGIEPRLRLSESWGVAVFYEVGNVYETPWPHLREGVRQSVGFGPRYYTPVGPLSLDIAFPLNRRKKVDRPFQVYVNIGQSF